MVGQYAHATQSLYHACFTEKTTIDTDHDGGKLSRLDQSGQRAPKAFLIILTLGDLLEASIHPMAVWSISLGPYWATQLRTWLRGGR